MIDETQADCAPVTVKSKQSADFDRVWFEYRPRLYRLAVRLSGCRDTADDLLQDIYLHAFAGYTKFRHKSTVYTWLYRITVNDTLRWRERQPRQATSLDSHEVMAIRATENDPYKIAELSSSQAVIWNALETLPEDIRTTLVLQLYEGLKYREIASLLDIPIGTVKSRLNTAIKLLREELKDYAL